MESESIAPSVTPSVTAGANNVFCQSRMGSQLYRERPPEKQEHTRQPPTIIELVRELVISTMQYSFEQETRKTYEAIGPTS